MVKVGKTTRDPEGRASELAGVTGVPVPFVVAYEQQFEDCDAAEQFVHEDLLQSRVSASREFFNAKPNEVIRSIIKATQHFSSGVGQLETEVTIASCANEQGGATANRISLGDEGNPWDHLEEQADSTWYGYADELENHHRAIEFYRQAIRLGSTSACRTLGAIYKYGEDDVPKDHVKAFELFELGVKRGDFSCHFEMAEIVSKHERNYLKCTDRYFDAFEEESRARPYLAQFVWLNCIRYVTTCQECGYPIKHADLLLKLRENISVGIQDQRDRDEKLAETMRSRKYEWNVASMADKYQSVMESFYRSAGVA